MKESRVEEHVDDTSIRIGFYNFQNPFPFDSGFMVHFLIPYSYSQVTFMVIAG
jgi:hypothetical protein